MAKPLSTSASVPVLSALLLVMTTILGCAQASPAASPTSAGQASPAASPTSAGQASPAASPTSAGYPKKAIRVVVGFSPGGGTDVVMRVVAKYLEQDLGVPVNIVNQPGGNRIPAVLTVLDAQPDGYWLLCEQEATSSIQSLISDLPYKIEDRTFGPMFAIEPAVFVVGGDSPWNSLQDVADAAKADPSSFTWTRLGGTSFTDFSLLQFFVAAGVDVSQTSPVDFDGSGPGITAVAGDHVMFGNTSVGAVLPLLSAGKLKVLAVTSDKRVNALPDVPTTSEAGFADVNLSSWYAISGPQGLPQEVVDRLDEAALRLSSNEAFQGELELLAVQTKYVPSSQMRDFITSQIGGFQDLSKAAAGN